MAKRIIAFTLTLAALLLCFTSCSIRGIGTQKGEAPRELFDENGNMLCDYYVAYVLLNAKSELENGKYAYVVHRYVRHGGMPGFKDLIYTDKSFAVERTSNHALVVYSSYDEYNGNLKFLYYTTPTRVAETRDVISTSELKNGGAASDDQHVYFCAEVTEIKSNSLIVVSPLDGAIENSIADKLSVKIPANSLGIKASDLSVGDRIRIYYDGGIWKNGVNITGTQRIELLQTKNSGYSVSFLGLITEDYTIFDTLPICEGADNGTEFTDGTVPGDLPTRIVKGVEELDSFDLKNTNFQYIQHNYDEKYFEENSLILVFLKSPSISYTYSIDELEISGGKLALKISETNAPQVPIDMQYIYAICVEVGIDEADSITDFDVELIN